MQCQISGLEKSVYLRQAVSNQLTSDVPLCTLLSGGLDSSAITALAAAEKRPGLLQSFSVDFRTSSDGFIRDAVREAPDSPFARELSQFVGTDHYEILLSGKELLSPEVRSGVLNAIDLPPCYWGDMWPSLNLLCREIKKYSTVALSGEGADELFGGYQWFFNPNATQCETFPWLTSGSNRYFAD
ncbi:asparagine synthase C-terminal domain-containing protein [Paenibacillus sp. PL2-23]